MGHGVKAKERTPYRQHSSGYAQRFHLGTASDPLVLFTASRDTRDRTGAGVIQRKGGWEQCANIVKAETGDEETLVL
ncbi:unnamed protein product [Arctogadus glacialis]